MIYKTFLDNEIARWIKIQEDIGLDVLVHGEFERNDMVEFFGEKLQGFLVTKFGWVQSYLLVNLVSLSVHLVLFYAQQILIYEMLVHYQSHIQGF